MMEVTSLIGHSGTFQNVVLLLAMYRGMMLAINSLGSPFQFPDIDHWCARPTSVEFIMSSYEWRQLAVPMGASGRREQCYQYNFSEGHSFGVMISVGGADSYVSCQSWEYSHEEFESSGTEQWNLVCDRAWLRLLPQSSYMIGLMVGTFVVGYLSDLYGRRHIMLYCLLVYVVLEALMAFVGPFWLFVALRFITAAAIAGMNNSLTLYVESVGAAFRGRVMWAYGVAWGAGTALLAFLAFHVPHWNHQLLLSASLYAAPLLFWSHIRESPKWQLAVGRFDEATRNIKTIRRVNGIVTDRDFDDPIVDKIIESLKAEHEDSRSNMPAQLGLMSLVKSPQMLHFTLSNLIFQFIVAIVRYSILLNTTAFPGSAHVNYVLGAGVEVLCGFCSMFCIKELPRKCTTVTCFCATIAAFCIMICLPEALNWAHFPLLFAIRFSLGVAYNVNIVYLSEIFPTSVRGCALGAANTIYSIGCAAQPFVQPLLALPVVGPLINAALCVVAVLCVLVWPETKDRPLPDHIERPDSNEPSVPGV